MKLCLLLALATGCALPPVEAHEAARELREDSRKIGSVSRQELESDVTDPASHVGTIAKPAPVPGNMSIAIVGMVSSKLCFRIDERVDANDFKWRMNNAQWSAQAVPARSFSTPAPWPTSQPAMVKVLEESDGVQSAVVCVPAPAFDDDTRLIAFALSWGPHKRKLALWQLTE
jgi:hypothetical protein